jgi:hypothetical protein
MTTLWMQGYNYLFSPCNIIEIFQWMVPADIGRLITLRVVPTYCTIVENFRSRPISVIGA